MLWCHFESTTHMLGNEFAGVLTGCGIDLLVLALVQQQVVAHTTADKTLLDAGQSIHGMIDVEQFAVVRRSVIFRYFRMLLVSLAWVVLMLVFSYFVSSSWVSGMSLLFFQ